MYNVYKGFVLNKSQRDLLILINVPIKIKGFSYVEISIYSRAGFFIYLFEDFLQNI